jgi:hypothetical protein
VTPPALVRRTRTAGTPDAARHAGMAAPGPDPSVHSYELPSSISEADLRWALPPDTPEDEAERVLTLELEDLDRARRQRKDLRDTLRHRVARLLDRAGESFIRRAGTDDAHTLTPNRDQWFEDEGRRLKKHGQRMRDCGEAWEGLEHLPCGETLVQKGATRWYCQLRDCPECQRIDAAKTREIAAAILKVGVRHALRFWTFTMPNVASLGGLATVGPRGGVWEGNALSRSSECFKEFRQLLSDDSAVMSCFGCKGMIQSRRTRKVVRELRAAFAAGNTACELPRTCYDNELEGRRAWDPLCRCESPEPRSLAPHAGIRSIETPWKWREDPDSGSPSEPPSVLVDPTPWHIHVHVLVDAPWAEQAILATLWMWVTLRKWPGGAANMKGVDVRNPYRKNPDGTRTPLGELDDPEELGHALAEVLKYPNKVAQFADCPDERVQLAGYLEWKYASAHRRLRQAFGAWEHWQELLDELDDEEDEDELDLDELPCPSCGALGEWRRCAVPDPTAQRSRLEFEQRIILPGTAP